MPTYRFALMFHAARHHKMSGQIRALNGSQGCGYAPAAVAPTKESAVNTLYSHVSEFTRPDARVIAIQIDGCSNCGADTAPLCNCGRKKFLVDCEILPSGCSEHSATGCSAHIVINDLLVVAWDTTRARVTALDVIEGWPGCDIDAAKIIRSVREITVEKT